MSEQTTSRVPTWFRVVVWVGLVWNLFGVMNFVMQALMSQEALDSFPEGMREYIAARPAWAMGAFAMSVFTGALGCGALVMRKKLPLPLLVVSLVAAAVTQLHFFINSNPVSYLSAGELIPGFVIIPDGVYLVYLARSAGQKGWLS